MKDKRLKEKEEFIDDGRTIVNMDVEGMPWYDKRIKAEKNAQNVSSDEVLSKEDRKHYIFGAVLAGLAVVAVFAAVFGLFIAFADFVWFK